ncbi:MAG: hypothetical protein OEZ68_16445 [Gammaproteobacteria bacterium]|nr:hypothetical protein [Gammaproteobacteria bacterium]MDH5802392.1 hypothetical protein [Gammaproteobacteria bacterium]
MNQEQFHYLYSNCNNLLDIAMKQAYSTLVPESTNSQSSEKQAESSGLDGGTLAGLNLDVLARLGVSTQESVEAVEGLDEFDPEEGIYTEEAGEQASSQWIDSQLFGRVDISYLETILQQLPQNLPTLTAELTSANLQLWSDVQKQHNRPLNELLQYMRRLAVEKDTVAG